MLVHLSKLEIIVLNLAYKQVHFQLRLKPSDWEFFSIGNVHTQIESSLMLV